MNQKKLINIYANLKEIANELSGIENRALNKIREKISNAIFELGAVISPDHEIRDVKKKSKAKRVNIASDSGVEVNIYNIPTDAIDPYYTIKTLAKMKRFNSNTELSVAEHCVNMANYFLSTDLPNKIDLAKYALTHEITEQFTGDVATPIKDDFPEIRILENDLLRRYWESINLNPDAPTELHKIDKEIMFAEAKLYAKRYPRWEELRLLSGHGIYEGKLPQRPLLRKDAMYQFANLWRKIGLPTNEKLENYLIVEHMVREHELWLKDNTKGERADFSFLKIEDFNFVGRNLENALFNGTKLVDCDLRECNLNNIENYGLIIEEEGKEKVENNFSLKLKC